MKIINLVLILLITSLSGWESLNNHAMKMLFMHWWLTKVMLNLDNKSSRNREFSFKLIIELICFTNAQHKVDKTSKKYICSIISIII